MANQGSQDTAALKIRIAFEAGYWYDFTVDCPSEEVDYYEDSQAVGF